MSHHVLKIDQEPFAALLIGAKNCEIRADDRGYSVGDTIQLHEREDADFTGRTLEKTITHIQRGYGLPDGICVLSYATDYDASEAARVKAEAEVERLRAGWMASNQCFLYAALDTLKQARTAAEAALSAHAQLNGGE